MIYNIAQHFNVVIANADVTGLNDNEELLFNEWEAAIPTNHYLVISNEETSWGKCDITGLDGDLIEVSLLKQ